MTITITSLNINLVFKLILYIFAFSVTAMCSLDDCLERFAVSYRLCHLDKIEDWVGTFPPKRLLTPTRLHGFTTQEIKI
jgi:hypothetical protein